MKLLKNFKNCKNMVVYVLINLINKIELFEEVVPKILQYFYLESPTINDILKVSIFVFKTP